MLLLICPCINTIVVKIHKLDADLLPVDLEAKRQRRKEWKKAKQSERIKGRSGVLESTSSQTDMTISERPEDTEQAAERLDIDLNT